MKTTREAKDRYIGKGSPIAGDLRIILFGIEHPVIVDCGACDGLDSIIYSNLLPNAKIYAIEPREDNILEIGENIGIYGKTQIIPMQACLDKVSRETSFWESSGQSGNVQGWDTGNKSSSILEPARHVQEHPWCKFAEKKINTVRFDSLGIDHVDFLHLDVQGAELNVLEGFGDVLKTLKAVWMEIACVELYRGQPLKKDVENFMSAHGFIKRIDKYNRREGDQLWVR